MLIIISSLICALRYSKLKTERISELKAICGFLELISSELTRLTPLPELVEKMCRRSNESSAAFPNDLRERLADLGKKDFEQLWSESVDCSFLMLHSSEKSELSAVGSVLGRYDSETQIAAIDDCRCGFYSKYTDELRELPQRRRLSFGLCVSAAALTAIALI